MFRSLIALLIFSGFNSQKLHAQSQQFLNEISFFFDSINAHKIFCNRDSTVFYFESGMSIDADGSPSAYCPADTGLDFLRNAGKSGHWWGIACDSDGIPFVQNNSDPNPGYYVSTTSLFDKTKMKNDPKRYVNSELIPYIVLPSSLMKKGGIKMGDFAFVQNGNIFSSAIVADIGPENKIGEGSIYLAKNLGISDSPKNGGTESGVKYIVFPKSGAGNGFIPDNGEIETKGKMIFEKKAMN